MSRPQRGARPRLGPYATPWDPPDAEARCSPNIIPVPEDYFTPGRFAGKTAIVTGSPRGMGRLAAIRLAREGANVVGVDWLKEEGQSVIDAIVREGGKAASSRATSPKPRSARTW